MVEYLDGHLLEDFNMLDANNWLTVSKENEYVLHINLTPKLVFG